MTAMMKSICTVLAAMAMMMAPVSAMAASPRCEPMSSGCIEVEQYPDDDSDTVIITSVTNSCSWRVGFRLCNEVESHGSTKWQCHNYDLKPDENMELNTFFATGRAKLCYVD